MQVAHRHLWHEWRRLWQRGPAPVLQHSCASMATSATALAAEPQVQQWQPSLAVHHTLWTPRTPSLWRRNSRRDTESLLLDVCGTLIVPAESTADVYHRYLQQYSTSPRSKGEILANFRRAYNTPWPEPVRYVGEARDFWDWIVTESTGCAHPEMLRKIYDYYTAPEAWRVAPGAREALQRLQAAGVSCAIVSNFDTRLRPLLQQLGLAHLFDAVICSAEVGWEKPNRRIFECALEALGTRPQNALHVGDDRRNDVWGARDAGVHAWLWGSDVRCFKHLADRVLHDSKYRLWDIDEEVGAEANPSPNLNPSLNPNSTLNPSPTPSPEPSPSLLHVPSTIAYQ